MILQIGKSYPFLQIGFWKKSVVEGKPSYYTEQHLFDPEKDRLSIVNPYILVPVGINYGLNTKDGSFKREYRLVDQNLKPWIIHFPEENPTRTWSAFELTAYRQGDEGGVCAFAEEVMTAYYRRLYQRQEMLGSSGNALWAGFYTHLTNVVMNQLGLNPEVYPLVTKKTIEVVMDNIPCVKLKPI